MANSTPIVDLESRLNSFRVNRLNRLDFPTPESPISTTTAGGWSVFGSEIACKSTSGRTFEEELQSKCLLAATLLHGVENAVTTESWRAVDLTYIVLVVGHGGQSGRLVINEKIAVSMLAKADEM